MILADEPLLNVPPAAAALINSLRGFGYSPETAIADLIDNSITAEARNVGITCDWTEGRAEISIVDDGRGMPFDVLREALRFGTAGPQAQRSAADLGRFGLGLKTASLSQCRRLTVVSRSAHAPVTALRWDLDYVEARNEWLLIEIEGSELEQLVSRLSASAAHTGTLVVWEQLDFGRRNESPTADGLRADAERIERHLSMTFHRFLAAPAARRLRIRLNGRELKAWDPMQEQLEQTIPRPEQRIVGPGGSVLVRGFVLPHRDRFRSEAEWEAAGGPAGWTAQQGFYVYRENRLISAGGWLGLGGARAWTREEPSRLARIRIDLPNTTDADWCIDVRKSTARPPRSLAPRLTGIAADVRKIAREVYVHRGAYGAREKREDVARIWEARAARQVPRYRLKRDHPALELLRASSASPELLEAALVLVERTVPVERIWLDSAEQSIPAPAPRDDNELIRNGSVLVRQLVASGQSEETAAAKVALIDPFDSIPGVEAALLRSAGRSRA